MKRILLTLALIAITAFGVSSLRAQVTNAPMATNVVAAAAPAVASTNLPAPTLDQRVAGLEAYIANTDPSASLKDTNGNMICQNIPVMNTAGPGHNAWMMTSTALVLVHDAARPCAVLRRSRSQEERALRAGAMLPHHRPGHDPVVYLRVQHGLWSGQPVLGQIKHLRLFQGRDRRARRRVHALGFAGRICVFPIDLRHHHPGADCWFHRRTHEIQGHFGVHDPLDVRGLFPAGAHGLEHHGLDERRGERIGRDHQGD